MDMDIKVYSLKEVSEMLTVSTRTLIQYIRDGRIRAVKIGGRWTVSEENLRHFVNGDTEEPFERRKRENIS